MTKYRLLLHREAVREIKSLPKKVRVQVRDVLDSLVVTPRPPEAVPLKGRKGAYRIRLGDYRLLYEVHATEIVIYVVGVAHRREVYIRLLRRR